MTLWNKTNEIFEELPKEVQQVLKLGFEDEVRYRKALEAHYSRHGSILNPTPKEIDSAVLDPIFVTETREGGDPTVSIAMCVNPTFLVDRPRTLNVDD